MYQVCEIKLDEYFQKSFHKKTDLCINFFTMSSKVPIETYIPRNAMLITLLKCLYTFNNKGGIQKISSYCFGHLTVPPSRIFLTLFSKVRKRQVCVIVLLLTKHNVILVLEFSAHGYRLIYRISSYSFCRNYSF